MPTQIAATSIAPNPTTTSTSRPPRRRSAWLIGASAFLIAAGLALGAVFWPRGGDGVLPHAAEPVLDDWVGIPGSRKDFKLKVEVSGGAPGADGVYRFGVGDRMNLQVEVDRDAYVGIWSVNSDGQITQLFPNKHDEANFLRAGETRRIPNGSYSIRARLDKGIECFRVIAATEPWKKWTATRQGDFLVATSDEDRKALRSALRSPEIVENVADVQGAAAEVVVKYLVQPQR